MREKTTRCIWQLILAAGLGVACGLVLWLGVFISSPEVAAQGGISWPSITLVKEAGGLSQPVHIAHAGDGSGRLFVVERNGRIRIIKNGTVLSTPFLDIHEWVGDSGSEQGLLSVAFPPDYASKGYFYVDYTDLSGDTVVARYRITSDPDVADPDSEEVILTVDQPYTNHNGGQLAFGPNDGYLYISMGDGGSGGDPQNNAQSPASLLGKILRIDVEPTQVISANFTLYLPIVFAENNPVSHSSYDIPASNPYTQTSGYRGEIWALGLRNPWRFAFDRQTGDLYIGDVGQGEREEIDYQPATSTGGENYGWNIMEGSQCYNATSCDTSGLTLPVTEYVTHSDGNCAVTGGMVYRGQDYPGMQGIYFYADYCSGQIWGLQYDGAAWQNSPALFTANFRISSFGEDEDGNLYVTDYSNGNIYMIVEGP
jgi:glucose/arabinose dehydrogenase